MKTLEEIKNEVAIEYSYESYDDFKNLTRKINTDIVFIMDEFFNKVAKRYAKEVAIASLESQRTSVVGECQNGTNRSKV